MPVVAGVGVLAVVIIAGVSGIGGTSSADNGGSTTASGSATAAPSSTAPAIVVATDPALPKTVLAHTIGKGNVGEDVKEVQQRLTDLGFAPGPIDGVFGSGTQQAVWAYEKLILKTPRDKATGKVTNEMWQTMQDRITIPPRRPGPKGTTHMEIYVPEQVAIVFKDNVPELITHISTGQQNPDGTPYHWCEKVTYDTGPNGEPLDAPVTKQECADAKTPGGIFQFTRRYEGKRLSPLGGMMNPVYFNFGIAVHGADNVPLQPASHGCVRINQALAKVFPSMVKKGDYVYVWGQDGKQPEQYTKVERYPSFNTPDPNATTTTESTTTTVAPTTVPPPTTVKSTTTTAAPTTTTATTTTVASATTTTSPLFG